MLFLYFDILNEMDFVRVCFFGVVVNVCLFFVFIINLICLLYGVGMYIFFFLFVFDILYIIVMFFIVDIVYIGVEDVVVKRCGLLNIFIFV